jgi:hypothetical protein
MARARKRLAQGLADHFNWLLNRTVSPGHLYIQDADEYPGQFEIRCGDEALELNGSPLFLWIYHRIAIDKKTSTQQYSYRLQTERADRRSWLLRWEYYRQRPADNPHVLGHVHVKGTLKSNEPSKGLPKLHIATGRVPLELVLWHLIADWDVTSLHEDWQAKLEGSLATFTDIRTA